MEEISERSEAITRMAMAHDVVRCRWTNEKMDEEMFRELEGIAMNEQDILEALEEWQNLSVDPENRYAYEMRLKWLLDQLSNIRGSREEGRQEGLKEGLKQGREEGKMKRFEKCSKRNGYNRRCPYSRYDRGGNTRTIERLISTFLRECPYEHARALLTPAFPSAIFLSPRS